MLPPYIIEQLRKRDEAQRRRQVERQVQVELPIPPHGPKRPPSVSDQDAGNRGVTIISILD